MYHFAEDTLNNGNVGPTHRKVVGYDSFGAGDQCVLDTNGADGGHGAKTSQHAVGSISNMTTNPDTAHTPNAHWDNGIARGAKVYFQDVGTSSGSIGPPGDLGPAITAAVGKSFVRIPRGARRTICTMRRAPRPALFNSPNFVVTSPQAAQRQASALSSSTAKTRSASANDVANS
jgi:hypothetical protein